MNYQSSMVRFWAVALWMVFSPAVVAAAPAASAEAAGDIERFALAVGANDGGPERERLRYASSDAERFVRVMQQLGGVTDDGTIWLEQPTPAALLDTFVVLAKRMRGARASGKRVQFIFYYSGHSDRSGLRLRADTVSYRELKEKIASLPADVKIGILDSCESGAFTRLKGGTRQAPFLVDRSNDVEGHAFLTSSAEHEAAQESDRIAGSFFTHALISGLRGAADVSGDGKVTLSEAYRFAFDETLARTQRTRAGAQHPAYDIRLAGTGDVVMTDLHTPSALLSIGESVAGRIFIRDQNGALVAELAKPEGRVIELGLPPGSYSVHVQTDLGKQAEVTLLEGQRTQLAMADLSSIPLEATALRGAAGSQGGGGDYESRPLALTVFPGLDTNPRYPARVENNLGVVLGYGEVAALRGLQVGLGVANVRERVVGVQASMIANVAEGPLDGAQFATVVNYTRDEARGLQGSSAVNLATGPLRGVQAAAGINLANELWGLQASGGINLAATAKGLQAAPVNLAETLAGLQLGVVNVGGRVNGLQLGVVNYAEDADAQLGVLSFSRKHGLSLQIYGSDIAPLQAALRFNAAYTYALLIVGAQPFGHGETQTLAALGFGLSGHIGPGMWLEGDLSWGQVNYGHDTWFNDVEDSSFYGQARLLFRLALGPVSLFAGPTLTTVVNHENFSGERPGFRYTLVREVAEDYEVLVRPGLSFGIQLL